MKGEVSTSPEETGIDAFRHASSLTYFSTGSRSMDTMMGGGLRAGSLTHVYGKSGSGKSQLAMLTVLAAAKNGTKSLYIDAEGAFRPERIEEMAKSRGISSDGLLDLIIYVRSDSSSGQMETIRSIPSREKTASCRIVVVDTLTRNFSVDLPGRANLSNRQAALDIHLSEMARDAYLHGRAYLLTNRVTFGPVTDVAIGGSTVEQMVETSIRLERSGSRVKGTLMPSRRSFSMELGASGFD
jgi:DNA repair protein RadA